MFRVFVFVVISGAIGIELSPSLAAEKLKLRDERTGAEYGPVEPVNGAKLKIGDKSYVVATIAPTPAQELLERKLKTTTISALSFEQASLQDVAVYLRAKSREIDREKMGINLLVFEPAGADASRLRLSLELHNVTLYDVIRYICEAGDLGMRIDDNAVVITPKPAK